MRAALHQAGASALSQLMRCEPPGAPERERPCPCGQQARYREMRARHVLTVVGRVEFSRPWYFCSRCHPGHFPGHFPADAALDIEKTDWSPGVRRMLALVGSGAPFGHGREQMARLAGLEVTTKSVERTAEAMGADIARQEQQEIQRAVQLDLPMIIGEPVTVLYIEMDGTGVPVVKKETAARAPSRLYPDPVGPQRLPDSRSRLHHRHGCHRERRAVRQATLRRSLETRLELCQAESRPRRRCRMDLEHRP